jgi:predicted nucleotidyltransferase
VTAEELQLPDSLRRALDETVRRIVEVARPQAVILFGSHAEGGARADSDLDFLVVTEAPDPSEVAQDLHLAMAELARGRTDTFPPADFVVLTPAEYEREAELPGLLVWRARRHGVVPYGHAA